MTVLAKILIGDLSFGVSGVVVRVNIVLVDGAVLSDDILLLYSPT